MDFIHLNVLLRFVCLYTITFLAQDQVHDVRTEMVGVQRAAQSSSIEESIVYIERKRKYKKVCIGVHIASTWILTLSDCIKKKLKPTEYSIFYKDGTKQMVIAEERNPKGNTLILLKIKDTGKTKFPRLSDSSLNRPKYDFYLYFKNDKDITKAKSIDFVSNDKCIKKGIGGKRNNCFRVELDKTAKCKPGSPFFGLKKNNDDIVLQGLSIIFSDTCTSTLQPMAPILPYLAWINKIIIDCGSVPRIKNGKTILDKDSKTTVGGTASIKCDSGYEADKKKIVCLKTGKWEDSRCIKIDCGSVENIKNGQISLDTSKSTVGATASIKCNPGYKASKKKIACLETGDWEVATCKVKDCGSSLTVLNGTLTFGTTTVGSIASVTCNSGYFTNQSTIECLTSASWETPLCVMKDCGPVKNITNGQVNLNEPKTSTVGATASITCKPGYEANKTKIACLETGQWEKTTCKVKDCGSSLTVLNGTLTFGTTTVGSIASVTCNSGYYSEKHNIECLTSGSWETPMCVIKDCGPVKNIINGKISLDTFNSTVGAIASLKCNSGYMTNKAKVACLETGEWEVTTCMIKDCGSSLTVLNGTLTFGTTTVGSIASVTCNSGYFSNQSTIECLPSSSWETPLCVIKDCGSVKKIENGRIKLNNSKTKVGATASIKCQSGFKANKNNITCLETGKWEEATCNIKDCGSSLTMLNGTLKFGTTTVGSIAYVTCASGFFAKKSTIKCLPSGTWKVPLCVIKDCGSNLTVTNGNLTLTGTTFGSTASLKCNIGYRANKDIIRCLETGSWELPECKDCGCDFTVANGNLTFTGTTFGSTASLMCDYGYLANNDTIRCLESGRWELAECKIIDCGLPPSLGPGGVFGYRETTFGSNASLICDHAYIPNLKTIQCLISGNWEQGATCTYKDCGKPPGNLVLDTGRSTYRETAKLYINTLNDFANMICLADGWTCVNEVCKQYFAWINV